MKMLPEHGRYNLLNGFVEGTMWKKDLCARLEDEDPEPISVDGRK